MSSTASSPGSKAEAPRRRRLDLATVLMMLAALLGARRASAGATDSPLRAPDDSGKPREEEQKSPWRRNWPNLVIVAMVLVAGGFAWLAESSLQPTTSTDRPCANVTPPERADSAAVIADAVGATNAIDIVVPRDGRVREGRSGTLAIQGDAALPPGTVLATSVSDLRREDGEVLPATQVGSRASVARNGREVTVVVCVAPRHEQISGFGKYTGVVALDDPRARGANMPVTVHVQYPHVYRVLFWTLLAAIGGLVWTWLIRHGDAQVTAEPRAERGGRTLGVRLAAILVAVPVVVTLVLDNPDWTGSLSSYVALATAAGAAVIAAAPTFRALSSRIQTTPDEDGTEQQAASSSTSSINS